MLTFKPTTMSGIPLVTALRAVGAVYGHHKIEAVVSSLNDGQHMVGSLHYQDKALDVRTWSIPEQANPCLTQEQMAPLCKQIILELITILGPSFQVIFETDKVVDSKQVRTQHIHIEYQPKEA